VAAGDLCTRADVNAFLQTPAGDTEQDTLIDTLITALTKTITREYPREFVKPNPDDQATRRFELDVAQPWLDLVPYDLRTPVSVTIDPDQPGGGTVLAEHTDLRYWPRPNPDGVFTAIRIVYLPPAVRTGGRWRLVDVRGNWGFNAVPEDVKQACVVSVAIWIRREVSSFTTAFNVDEQRLERPEAIPSAARALLANYRRQTAV